VHEVAISQSVEGDSQNLGTMLRELPFVTEKRPGKRSFSRSAAGIENGLAKRSKVY